MKKYILVAFCFLASGSLLLAQQDDEDEGIDKVGDKMMEYISRQLDVSKDESKKFTPAFRKYFQEWRKTIRDNRGDRLILRQKVTDLQVRHRNEFREILGENRGNQVFKHQNKFIADLNKVRNNRRRNN